MSQIFISYRRGDTSAHAGRLYDRLSDKFGVHNVFMDVDTIEPGADFVEYIDSAVGSCDILIAVIGRDWLSAPNATGASRLADPEDFVRLEVAAGLERNVRVIPALVEGATMPTSQDLPEPLVKLARRNALELSDSRWRHDVGRLVEAIEKVLKGHDTEEAVKEAAEEQAAERPRTAAGPQAQTQLPAQQAPPPQGQFSVEPQYSQQPQYSQRPQHTPQHQGGQAWQQPSPRPVNDPVVSRAKRANVALGLSIAAMILSLLWLGILFAIPALILSRVLLSELPAGGEEVTRTRSKWAFWLGVISSVLSVIIWVLTLTLA